MICDFLTSENICVIVCALKYNFTDMLFLYFFGPTIAGSGTNSGRLTCAQWNHAKKRS